MLRRGGHRLVPPSTNYPDIEDISTVVAQCSLCDGSLTQTEGGGWSGSLLQGDTTCYVAKGRADLAGPDFKMLSRDQQREITFLRGKVEKYRQALEEIELSSNANLGVGHAHDDQVFQAIATPGRIAREALKDA